MRKIARITGEIVGWSGANFVIKNAINRYNEGFLEIYTKELNVLTKSSEIKKYSKVLINEGLILFQENAPDNIYILNENDLTKLKAVIEGEYYLGYKKYERYYFVSDHNSNTQYYYLDQRFLTLVPTGFIEIKPFDYTHNGHGIRYYKNCIYCYSLDTKELVWKISTPEMQYDRGGRHMTIATPDNDVPDKCYFHEDLLIAVFESHTAGIELSSGRVVWEDNLGSSIHSDFLEDGILYVNCFGLFYQLDASTGRLLYEKDLYAEKDTLTYDITTDMVHNSEHIYFCMTRRKTLVTLRKYTFELVSEEKIPDSGGGLLYANTKIFLRENKLFLTLRNDPPKPIYETLVYEV